MGLMDKANEFLNSEQGEQMSDQGLQFGADTANKVSGGKFGEQIAQGQQMADDRLGQPGQPGQPGEPGQPGQPEQHPGA